MALEEEGDLLVGPAPPNVALEDELASSDERSREVARILSYALYSLCILRPRAL